MASACSAHSTSLSTESEALVMLLLNHTQPERNVVSIGRGCLPFILPIVCYGHFRDSLPATLDQFCKTD